MKIRTVHAVVLAVLAFAGPATGQSEPDSAIPGRGPLYETSAGAVGLRVESRATTRRVRAVRLEAADAIRLDGALDEPAWEAARWLSDFRQKEPDQDAPPTFRTEVAFLFDDDALYAGARMESLAPERVMGRITRRDEAGNADRLVVSLDTFNDRRTAYSFAVTAAGVRLDWYHPEDREDRRDSRFDPVWEARTGGWSGGWTAEIRIPFSQLRFVEGSTAWGLNVSRFIPSRNEEVYWVLVRRDETGWASRFGVLEGLEGLESSRPLEVRPFAVGEARVQSPGRLLARDPFSRRFDSSLRAGADLKLGLGQNLTLDATVNPDFGQVEFDPAVVNLGPFETVFAERRSFFTEGSELLSGGDGPRFFFSRRIGAEPRGRPSADFADVPESTTILTAAKLTGRLRSGLSVGALAAATAAESAPTFDAEADTFGRVPVEPGAAYGAVRLQQEFGAAASTVGLLATGVTRDVEPGDGLASLLPRRAVTGKADWDLRFEGGAYELGGHLGFSRIEGDSSAIGRIQRSSSHLFQRPDQGHVRFDPSRTALTGWTAGLRFSKNAGDWLVRSGLETNTPGLELNDVGQLFRADVISGWFDLTYRDTEPGARFRAWSLGLQSFGSWNFAGIRRGNLLAVRGEVTWPNFMRTDARFGWIAPVLSDDLTRGGPLMRRPADWIGEIGFESDPAAGVRWSFRAFRGNRNFEPDWIVRTALTIDPAARWRLSLEPRYLRLADGRQYVTTLDGGPSATFGLRYVFATVRVREIALPLRLSYAFTPDVSLDFAAEPFAASGRFTRFGELTAPRTSELRPYDTAGTRIERVVNESGEQRLQVTDGDTTFVIPVPDFRRTSFRTRLVLRWEWQPGSTLFLVWRSDRGRSETRGDGIGPAELGEALTTPGTDSLILKISYWLPVSL